MPAVGIARLGSNNAAWRAGRGCRTIRPLISVRGATFSKDSAYFAPETGAICAVVPARKLDLGQRARNRKLKTAGFLEGLSLFRAGPQRHFAHSRPAGDATDCALRRNGTRFSRCIFSFSSQQYVACQFEQGGWRGGNFRRRATGSFPQFGPANLLGKDRVALGGAGDRVDRAADVACGHGPRAAARHDRADFATLGRVEQRWAATAAIGVGAAHAGNGGCA